MAIAIESGAVAERLLSFNERILATNVFKATLPYNGIWIANDLGPQNRAWVSKGWSKTLLGIADKYVIHLGPIGYQDSTNSWIRNSFIHELTHVWQGYKNAAPQGGYVFSPTLCRCVVGILATNPYSYQFDGRPWSAYTAEQQGDIVRDWFAGGMSTSHPAYSYIKNAIQAGNPFWRPPTLVSTSTTLIYSS